MRETIIHLSASRERQKEQESGIMRPGKIVAAAEWRGEQGNGNNTSRTDRREKH